MKIIILNNQRSHKLDKAQMQTMVDKLTEAVFDNLKKRKSKRLANLGIIEKSSLINLIIVSSSRIRKLNKLWLHKDKETDVLSFPLIDLSDLDQGLGVNNFTCSSNSKGKQAGKENFHFVLGEIFISYEQAIIQAKEYNHSLERELAFLFVHGLLHILGFDHQNKADEKEMFGHQKEILVKAGYAR